MHQLLKQSPFSWHWNPTIHVSGAIQIFPLSHCTCHCHKYCAWILCYCLPPSIHSFQLSERHLDNFFTKKQDNGGGNVNRNSKNDILPAWTLKHRRYRYKTDTSKQQLTSFAKEWRLLIAVFSIPAVKTTVPKGREVRTLKLGTKDVFVFRHSRAKRRLRGQKYFRWT